MSEELKACPFCGSHEQAIWTRSDKKYVRCMTCRSQSSGYEKKEQAITAWNTRAGEKA